MEKQMSIDELIHVIRGLPSDRPGKDPQARYKTQKAHWLGWLRIYTGSQADRRKTGMKRDARYAYEHALYPEMLLYLIRAVGLRAEQVEAAEKACERGSGSVEKLNAIRKAVPWSQIYQAISGKEKQSGDRSGPSDRFAPRGAPTPVAHLRAQRRESRPEQGSGEQKKQPEGIVQRDEPAPVQNLALSIRQPLVEQILRGTKQIEYRNVVTNIRGRVYLYASLKPAEWAYEEMGTKPGDFPTGAIIGTVEIVDCIDNGVEYEWRLARPERLEQPVKPQGHPQPVWFKPFPDWK